MNAKLRREARSAVSGLLKMDKMRLIYWLLKAHQRDRWLISNDQAPLGYVHNAKALQDMLEDASVDLDSASHHFLRFCEPIWQWWVCSQCGAVTDHEETKPGPHHDDDCTGVCDYKITGCDFYDDANPQPLTPMTDQQIQQTLTAIRTLAEATGSTPDFILDCLVAVLGYTDADILRSYLNS
jgi:hypothetical protein